MYKMVKRVATGAALAVVSVGAFAQASGTAITDTAIVSSITSVTGNVEDIGVAVLSVVTVVFAFRLLKGFIAR
ncbi:major capsid protein [Paraburkholderia sp. GAS82]|uniref:major capsid protein n=1 Tax=Paraburkholderia sp. GAS82 TaxID=3035137 RepID=UPI003D1EF2A3